jgi:hypothetical protein
MTHTYMTLTLCSLHPQLREGTSEHWTLEGLKHQYGDAAIFVSSNQVHNY